MMRLYLVDGDRYRVRGVGPIVSPPLVWRRCALSFVGRRGAAYGVDDVHAVQPLRSREWVPIDACGMAPATKAPIRAYPRPHGEALALVRACLAGGDSLTYAEVAVRTGLPLATVVSVLRRNAAAAEFVATRHRRVRGGGALFRFSRADGVANAA